MAIGGQSNYPSLNTIANLVRSLVNDDQAGITGTAGEGQILVNPVVTNSSGTAINNPAGITLTNLMNQAIRETYRDIQIMDEPTLIRDNYVLYGLPVLNSSLGSGVQNPATQVYLGYVGFFDGLTIHPQFLLPGDLIYPLEMWERLNGTTNEFGKMTNSKGPLPPTNQTQWLGAWEYRGDAIWMPGATTSRDIRLRYISRFVDVAVLNQLWTNLFVPILDSEEAIADKIVLRYSRRLASTESQALIPDLIQQADRSIHRLAQRVAKSRQKIDYQWKSYLDDNKDSTRIGAGAYLF